MFEIYARHAGRYHELVSAEDYQGNLAALLRELVDWDGAQSRAGVRFLTADNLDLPDLPENVHVFVEGWSFGHSVADLQDTTTVDQTVDALVRNAMKNLAPGGTAIIIETLGTNTTVPQAPLETLKRMYERLEGEHAFTRHEIRTDFRFPSLDTAADTMGFFFGDEMGRAVRAAGPTAVIVPEWTGVWSKA
jgi:hypothetical protein